MSRKGQSVSGKGKCVSKKGESVSVKEILDGPASGLMGSKGSQYLDDIFLQAALVALVHQLADPVRLTGRRRERQEVTSPS